MQKYPVVDGFTLPGPDHQSHLMPYHLSAASGSSRGSSTTADVMRQRPTQKELDAAEAEAKRRKVQVSKDRQGALIVASLRCLQEEEDPM